MRYGSRPSVVASRNRSPSHHPRACGSACSATRLGADNRFELRPTALELHLALNFLVVGRLLELGVDLRTFRWLQLELRKPAFVVDGHRRAIYYGALDVVDADVVAEPGRALREPPRGNGRRSDGGGEELIQLARDMRAASARGEQLGLTDDEVAFYDALETNDSAVKVLGDEALRTIARELVKTVRANVTIDWTVRDNVRAQLRVLVKRILRKYGYPPDLQERATQTVLEQAALFSTEWASA
jgi:hypothetical protein